MNIKSIFLSILFAWSATTANAAVVTWTFQDVVFDDGGTLTGSFDYDADINRYSNIVIETTAGANLSGASYGVPFRPGGFISESPTNLVTVVSNDESILEGTTGIRFTWSDALTNAGGLVEIFVVQNGFQSFEATCESECGSFEAPLRTIVSGSISAPEVPLPAAFWFMGVGLVAFRKAFLSKASLTA